MSACTLPVIKKLFRLIKRFRSSKMYASSQLGNASGNLENFFRLIPNNNTVNLDKKVRLPNSGKKICSSV
jgi:hypothetical protein